MLQVNQSRAREDIRAGDPDDFTKPAWRGVAQQVFRPGQFLVAVLLVLGLWPAASSAIGLGSVQLRSNLGEPLRLLVTVVLQNGDEVGCVNLSNPPSDEASFGSLTLRHKVLETAQGTRLEITSVEPVYDPVFRVNVSLGCAAGLTREYVLFLDPPMVFLPQTEDQAQDRAAPAVEASVPARVSAPARVATPVPSPRAPAAAPTRRSVRPAAPPASLPESAPAPAAPKPAAKPAAPAPKAPAVAAGDRLKLSSAIDIPVLRTADGLTQPDETVPTDPERLKELKAEQARLAATVEGKDPSSLPSDREAELQRQLMALASETAALRKQMLALESRTQAMQSGSSHWLNWLLGALALLALVAAGLLALALRRETQRKAQQPWWVGAPGAVASRSAADRSPQSPAVQSRVQHPVAPADEAPTSSAAQHQGTDEDVPVRPGFGNESIHVVEEDDEDALKPFMRDQPGPPSAAAAGTSRGIPASGRDRDSYTPERSVKGSLDERIDVVPGGQIDIPLDVPAVTNNLGKNVFGVAPLNAPPVEVDFPLLDMGGPGASRPGATHDTVLRLDDDAAQAGLSLPGLEGESSEHASLQFRMIQFATVTEQVDELMRMHDDNKAITLLRRYVLRDESIPTLMWLQLFELYRRVDKRPVYDALADHFARRYQRSMIKWDERLEDRTVQSSLQDMTEINASLQAQWGTEAGLESLSTLVCGHDQPDAVVFNGALQRDLLRAAKSYPLNDGKS